MLTLIGDLRLVEDLHSRFVVYFWLALLLCLIVLHHHPNRVQFAFIARFRFLHDDFAALAARQGSVRHQGLQTRVFPIDHRQVLLDSTNAELVIFVLVETVLHILVSDIASIVE